MLSTPPDQSLRLSSSAKLQASTPMAGGRTENPWQTLSQAKNSIPSSSFLSQQKCLIDVTFFQPPGDMKLFWSINVGDLIVAK